MAIIAALQMTSTPDVDENFDQIHSLLSGMQFDEPTLIVLPECFAFFGGSDRDMLAHAEARFDGKNINDVKIQSALIELAKNHGVWLVAGTIPVQTETQEKFTASSFVIDDTGNVKAEYRKIHMFDVQVSDSTGSYRESRFTQHGTQTCVVPDTPFGRLGVAVCYDIRFPGQFMAMGEFDVLALPAAFTQRTGSAHWHKLLSARSIENQCYVVAANQSGTHANNRETFGHSCIYSPWGELLAETLESPGFAFSGVNTSYLDKIRATMPVQQQNRFRSKFV
jgi:nitrilase